MESPLASPLTLNFVVVCFTCSGIKVILTLMLGVRAVPTVRVSFSPHAHTLSCFSAENTVAADTVFHVLKLCACFTDSVSVSLSVSFPIAITISFGRM